MLFTASGLSRNGSIWFAAGQLSASLQLQAPPTDGLFAGPVQAVRVRLSNPSGAELAAIVRGAAVAVAVGFVSVAAAGCCRPC